MTMTTSLSDRVREVVGTCKEWIKELKAMSPDRGGLQELATRIRNLLRENKMLEKQRWKPQACGVHPRNRSSGMLGPADCHALLDYILLTRWAWSEVGNPTAVEVAPPGEANRDDYLSKNEQLSQASGGLLAPCERDLIRALTVAGSHTTAALRCCAYETKSPHDTISQDGKLSLAKLRARDPTMYEAVMHGLAYEAIPWQVDAACPDLVDILIEADNLKHRAARDDTE